MRAEARKRGRRRGERGEEKGGREGEGNKGGEGERQGPSRQETGPGRVQGCGAGRSSPRAPWVWGAAGVSAVGGAEPQP